jgi:GST-like protein
VPVEVELLVVPDEVPPVVSDGTVPGRLGTPPGRLGTPLDKVGTPPGSAGTAGTVGPVALVVPTGGVTTVVTPEAVVGGMTTGVRPAGAPAAAEGVVVVVVIPDDAGVPPPVTTRGEPPSGSTQFTSRFEQKSGMVVRSVDSAASAVFTSAVTDSAAKAAEMALKAIRRCMVAPSGRCHHPGCNTRAGRRCGGTAMLRLYWLSPRARVPRESRPMRNPRCRSSGQTCRAAVPGGGAMIDVHTWPTPNGHKVHIMLEETGLEYRVYPVNIREGDQFKPTFLEISPNNRIPAIVDDEGPGGKPISLFESGAILLYLASKAATFLPVDMAERWTCVQWLMWQMGGLGPMMGQANHFRRYAKDKIEYAIERYTNEANRLTNVLDKRLAESEYVACDEYTIADISIFPWLRGAESRGVLLDDYPNVKRWFDAINVRPAVQRGLKVLADAQSSAPHDPKSWEIMFGKTQFQRR